MSAKPKYKCGLCDPSNPKNYGKAGLVGHVYNKHKMAWKTYQAKFLGSEAPPPAVQPPQTPQVTVPPSTTSTPPQPASPAKSDVGTLALQPQQIDQIAKRVVELFQNSAKAEALTPKDNDGQDLAMVDVEVEGDKVPYRMALNPEIFHNYNIFKALSIRKGNSWKGTFGDWLFMCTRDILKVYGIYPTVISMQSGKLLVELPQEAVSSV